MKVAIFFCRLFQWKIFIFDVCCGLKRPAICLNVIFYDFSKAEKDTENHKKSHLCSFEKCYFFRIYSYSFDVTVRNQVWRLCWKFWHWTKKCLEDFWEINYLLLLLSHLDENFFLFVTYNHTVNGRGSEVPLSNPHSYSRPNMGKNWQF